MSHEQYVAIDNVCAWPNLSRLPDGRLSVAIFNQPTHGGWEGQVECWLSNDDGRTWSRAGAPVPHDPGTARMNHAAGIAGNGDLIVIVAGHSGRPKKNEPNLDFAKSVPLHPIAARSSDGGVTWSPCAPIPPTEDGGYLCPFGSIQKQADGVLMVSFYTWHRPGAEQKMTTSALLYRSVDDGHTWQRHRVIAADDYNETTIHVVNENRIIAAARSIKDQTLHLFISDDAGDTWRFGGPLSGAFEHNADFLALPDGRILLTYGIRHPHDLALACRVSPDAGLTWRRPHRLLQIDNVERYDGGYPSSVLVSEDSVLTAYYTRRSPWHQRYHMGAIIWNWRAEFDHGFDK